MKKGKKILFGIIFAIVVLFILMMLFGDDEDMETGGEGIGEQTSYYQEGTDADKDVDASSMTLMVYICGADLESDYGAATADIQEMLYAELSDKVNVVIETGGAKKWQNSVISAKSLQRFLVTNDGLELLEDVGKKQITTADEMGDFIRFAAEKYPADRYGFIFWNHGGGTLGGYGADQNYKDASMDIAAMEKGFAKGGVHFNFIGYDCCLMATIENAYALRNHADYLIASEESEPGTGWYYTNFLTALSKDPGMSTLNLAKYIIDDFNNGEYTEDIYSGVTLSLVDLKEIEHLADKFFEYMTVSEDVLLNENGYSQMASARAKARSYGDDGFEQIDIVDYLDRVDIVNGTELKNAVMKAIVYNKTNMTGSNGLAMYYPYYMQEYYSDADDLTNSIGFTNDGYDAFFRDFITIGSNGRVSGGGNSNKYSNEETEYEDYTAYDWYDEDAASAYEGEYEYIDGDTLYIDDKGEYYALSLSDEDWDLVAKLELQVYLDDGDGYRFLGSDNYYTFDDDGDLIVDFDYTWVAMNGTIVPFYAEEEGDRADGTYYTMGYVPAVLNDDEDISIWILWEGENDPIVLGYTKDSNGGSGTIGVASKGYISFTDGDVIDVYYDYYDYDGNYDGAYFLEDNQIVYSAAKGLVVSYEEVDDYDAEICYYLVDIYQNEYWTESVVYE